MKKVCFGLAMAWFVMVGQVAQAQFWKDHKIPLNDSGSNYIKFTGLAQIWGRYLSYNPGSNIEGDPTKNAFDIGIRRARIQMIGQLTDRVFIYMQVGENNFNNVSDRKAGFFMHDIVGEYAIVPQYFSLGGGLSGWSGLSRFASPAVGSIMGLDAPLYLQSTNDATDQFLRKLEFYGKGKIGKFDYRVAMAQPMAIQKSTLYVADISTNSNFSPKAPKMQWNGYFQYQFLDRESNQTPYNTGTYLGKKRVLNVGAGFVYQAQAMWHKEASGDTSYTPMTQLSAEVFYDAPIGEKGEALSVFANYAYMNFGKDYIRNLSPMNPATGVTSGTLNGSGNGFPAIGTGHTAYAQVGYKTKNNLIYKYSLMPYGSMQVSFFDRLNSPMLYFELGSSILLEGHTSKLTLAYQNRPIFTTAGDFQSRASGVVMQYQVFFN